MNQEVRDQKVNWQFGGCIALVQDLSRFVLSFQKVSPSTVYGRTPYKDPLYHDSLVLCTVRDNWFCIVLVTKMEPKSQDILMLYSVKLCLSPNLVSYLRNFQKDCILNKAYNFIYSENKKLTGQTVLLQDIRTRQTGRIFLLG